MAQLAALILVLLAGRFPLSGSGQALTESGSHPFAINFPQGVDVGKVQVKYFIAGEFGGLNESALEKAGEHRIVLRTGLKERQATYLKAIVYVHGCQLATIDVPDLAVSSREFSFECRRLPTVPFTGRVASAEPIIDPQPVVTIEYMAFWAHSFFGIQDGMVTSLQIATAPLEPAGVFDVALPDFSQDEVTRSHNTDLRSATLSFIVRDAKTWNILGRLDDLPVRSEYPPEVALSLHKM